MFEITFHAGLGKKFGIIDTENRLFLRKIAVTFSAPCSGNRDQSKQTLLLTALRSMYGVMVV